MAFGSCENAERNRTYPRTTVSAFPSSLLQARDSRGRQARGRARAREGDFFGVLGHFGVGVLREFPTKRSHS